MSIYTFPVKTIQGEDATLEPFKGKVLLIVNVASACGYTPQYAGLEELQKKFASRGFSVLGFPCNQFGGQEPGTEAEVCEFATRKMGATFPMFSKIEVNGPDAHPLYQHLKSAAPGIFGTEAIKWNFTKFLIDRNGNVVARYAPKDTPESIEPEIAKLLG
jgi:glutathione peroxidase